MSKPHEICGQSAVRSDGWSVFCGFEKGHTSQHSYLPPYRVGTHYGIHVYQGDRPVATFFRPDEAAAFVRAINGS